MKNVFKISTLCLIIIFSLVSCSSNNSNLSSKEKALLSKSYSELTNDERIMLVDIEYKMSEDDKKKYENQIKRLFVEQHKSLGLNNEEAEKLWNSKQDYKERKAKGQLTEEEQKIENSSQKEEDNVPKSVASIYKAKFGKVIEANKLEKSLTIKFKISPSYSNKTTIHQNGYNVEDLILNQGGDEFEAINYWAVADMDDGSESKVIAFTLDKNLINDVKNRNIVGNQIVDKAKDVWILPSLKN